MRRWLECKPIKNEQTMNNIYHEAVLAVGDGARFKVDFRTRSLKLDGKYIIQAAEYEGELGIPPCGEDGFFPHVEELYRRYKHSVPSLRSEGKSRLYFKALPEKELSDEAMLYGEHREKAQIELELYILCQILQGFRWSPETMGKWFWQSKKDKDLVILRSWIETEAEGSYLDRLKVATEYMSR